MDRAVCSTPSLVAISPGRERSWWDVRQGDV
jgi:hypothetical protein